MLFANASRGYVTATAWTERPTGLAMKVKQKSFTKNGTGSIKLTPESEEDLWHIYNLIRAGDRIYASTTRKVQVRYCVEIGMRRGVT